MDDPSELIHVVQTLNAPDAFRPRIGPEQWRVITQYLTRHDIRAGDLLIKQGEGERTMYLLERGSLQVFVTVSAGAAPGSRRVAILRPGAVVGEAGLFGEGPRMANVEAMTACVVWALRGPRFEEMAARQPALAFEVVRAAAAVLAARMRENLRANVPVS
jgi:CRP-like cAMP-binding protein